MDPKVIMDSARGRRSIDTIKLYDPSKANGNVSIESRKISGVYIDSGQTCVISKA